VLNIIIIIIITIVCALCAAEWTSVDSTTAAAAVFACQTFLDTVDRAGFICKHGRRFLDVGPTEILRKNGRKKKPNKNKPKIKTNTLNANDFLNTPGTAACRPAGRLFSFNFL